MAPTGGSLFFKCALPSHHPPPLHTLNKHKKNQKKGLAKIAFTGSTATGKRVAAAALENLRPATMELGGKSCLIIFNDADVDKAVEWVMFGAFWTNGQICSSTSRILVHDRLVCGVFVGRLCWCVVDVGCAVCAVLR